MVGSGGVKFTMFEDSSATSSIVIRPDPTWGSIQFHNDYYSEPRRNSKLAFVKGNCYRIFIIRKTHKGTPRKTKGVNKLREGRKVGPTLIRGCLFMDSACLNGCSIKTSEIVSGMRKNSFCWAIFKFDNCAKS